MMVRFSTSQLQHESGRGGFCYLYFLPVFVAVHLVLMEVLLKPKTQIMHSFSHGFNIKANHVKGI